MAEDAVLHALAALEEVIAENDRRATLIKRRMTRIRRARAAGLQYSDAVANEDGPLIVQLVTESSAALDRSGANVRRAEAEALYAEGMTMDQIARPFRRHAGSASRPSSAKPAYGEPNITWSDDPDRSPNESSTRATLAKARSARPGRDQAADRLLR